MARDQRSDNFQVVIDDSDEEPAGVSSELISSLENRLDQELSHEDEAVIVVDSDDEAESQATAPPVSSNQEQDSDYDDTFGPDTDMPDEVSFQNFMSARSTVNKDEVVEPDVVPSGVNDGIEPEPVLPVIIAPVDSSVEDASDFPDPPVVSEDAPMLGQSESPTSESVEVCEADSPTVEIDVAMETPAIVIESDDETLVVSSCYSISMAAFDDENVVSSSTAAEDISPRLSRYMKECWRCKELLSSEKALFDHFDSLHPDLKPYKCEDCGIQYKHAQTLREHMNVHKGIKPFKCEECGKCFYDHPGLYMHKQTHKQKKWKWARTSSPEEPPDGVTTEEPMQDREGEYNCKYCGEYITSQLAYVAHCASVHRKKMAPCGVCSRVFPSAWNKLQHMESHQRSKLHKCDICGEQFNQASALWLHRKNRHRAPNAIFGATGTKNTMSQNVVSTRPRSALKAKYTPTEMKKSSNMTHKPSSLRYMPHRQVECDICGELFDYNITMYNHKRNVHGVCKQKSSTVSALGRRTSTGVHSCQSCQENFPTASALLQHYKAKPNVMFNCDMCNQEFGTTCALVRHQHQKHPTPDH